jgi:hypothetical protein
MKCRVCVVGRQHDCLLATSASNLSRDNANEEFQKEWAPVKRCPSFFVRPLVGWPPMRQAQRLAAARAAKYFVRRGLMRA